jgi:hypothetical protein
MKEENKGYYHPEVIARREALIAETNKNGQLVIDRECWRKTPEEKKQLKEAKAKYKRIAKWSM